jgi:hypothetical protein
LGDKRKRGGRHQANLSKEEEHEFLAPFFEKAKSGGILVVNDIGGCQARCRVNPFKIRQLSALVHCS